MEAAQADLIVTGKSPCVLELADGKIDGHVKQRNPIGSNLHGEPLSQNVVIIGIPTGTHSDDSAFETISNWLNRNRNALIQCDANKTLEFYTYLQPDIGSRILTIPTSLIRIAAELGLNVANQAIRIITEDEYNELKR